MTPGAPRECAGRPLGRARLFGDARRRSWSRPARAPAGEPPVSRVRRSRPPPDAVSCPTCCARRSRAASTSCSCATSSLPDDELTARRERRARAVRAARRRCSSSTTVPQSRPRSAPTASTSARTTCRWREVRELVGADMLIGLSTHSPAQIDAVDASLVDYIGVGPVHATPTKPGRPAVGRGARPLRGGARARAVLRDRRPGRGQHRGGARGGRRRVCVLRAIADAADPEAAARELRATARRRPGRHDRERPCRPSRAEHAPGIPAEPRARARRPRARPARARWSRCARTSARRRCWSRSRVCAVLAVVVLVGALSVHDLSSHGGSLPGAIFLAVVLGAARASACIERRYWAVLAFEALLAFQIIVTSLALVVADLLAARAVSARDRPRGLAVLEARARDGPHPGWRTRVEPSVRPSDRRAPGRGSRLR